MVIYQVWLPESSKSDKTGNLNMTLYLTVMTAPFNFFGVIIYLVSDQGFI